MKRNGKKFDGSHGMTFGSMDAIINVVGILAGLGVVGNKAAVILGILIAGVANSFGNSAGFHVSEETEGIHSRKEVWSSSIHAFFSTFLVTLVLLVPPLILDLSAGILISIVMGIALLVGLGLFVGRRSGLNKNEMLKIITEYVTIGISVIVISYVLGNVVIFLASTSLFLAG
jgi:hypothetical protein